MKDSRERFTATADLYDLHRPSYPAELVDWLVAAAGLKAGSAVADIGCGTGISARLFSARGFTVVGIDPNEAMLAKARAKGGADYRRGESNASGLPDASQDLVFAAQAFHWFDIPTTLAEWRRILKPGGLAAAFWNDRTADTPFLKEYEALLQDSSAEYRELTRRRSTFAELRESAGVKAWTPAEFSSSQTLDRESLFGRAYSSSYVAHGVRDHAAFDKALNALFERHAVNARIEFRYLTVAAHWRL